MTNNLKRSILTHGAIILGFFIVTVIVYAPFFFESKQLAQHDILQGLGSNYQLKEYRAETGEEALWNNAMFSGMPAYLTSVQFPGDILTYVYQIFKLGLPNPEGITLVCFICSYIMLLSFGVRPWVAFAGAIAFGLNGFNIISLTAGHNSKIAALAFAPLVLAGIHLAFTRKKYLGIGLTSLGLAMQIYMNHPQITYYLLITVLVYGVFQLYYFWKDHQIKSLLLTLAGLILAASIAVGANSGKLWTVYEYSKYSIRGKSELKDESKESSGLDKEYAFRYSNGILEPLFLFIPNIYGGSSSQELSTQSATAGALRQAGYNGQQLRDQLKAMPTYWGDQPLTAPYYAGALSFFLFVLGIFVLDRRTKTWLIVVALIGIVLSWGSNFTLLNDLLFDHFPMYNKFRSVTFAICMTLLSINLMGFMALERVLTGMSDKAFRKKFLWSVAICGGTALLLVIAAGALSYRGSIDARLPEWLIDALRSDRESLLRSDALKALFFILAFSGLIWAYWKNSLKSVLIISGIILLLFVDIFSLTKRFLNKDSFENRPVKTYFKPTEADLYIRSIATSGERVLNLQNPFNEARTSYHHESIGGYHGAKMRRYQDLISACIQAEMSETINVLQSGGSQLPNTPVLNMLNTRFFLAGSSKNAVISNSRSLGNGWIVSNLKEVASADEELSEVCGINPSRTAVIDGSKFSPPNLIAGATGTVKLLSRTPNEIKYTTQTSGKSLAVFSEIYYPKGWKAYIDDQEAEILRVNYILRALPLEKGTHEIRFVFEPTSYYAGNTLTIVGEVLVFLLFIGGIWMERRKSSL
ncbi:YfhO family protein [Marinoscillum sp. 108]|uniref:YfhO family protein n=1 Tax=Marinoscillum sp. 108 TaxID=2653151 RepID=UPI0012F237B1|nr:YfhO family protein [Marinoscillum sp. 108]VXD10681.1 Membrane protein YfhO [Marinoscillum sp. 108]